MKMRTMAEEPLPHMTDPDLVSVPQRVSALEALRSYMHLFTKPTSGPILLLALGQMSVTVRVQELLQHITSLENRVFMEMLQAQKSFILVNVLRSWDPSMVIFLVKAEKIGLLPLSTTRKMNGAPFMPRRNDEDKKLPWKQNKDAMRLSTNMKIPGSNTSRRTNNSERPVPRPLCAISCMLLVQ